MKTIPILVSVLIGLNGWAQNYRSGNNLLNENVLVAVYNEQSVIQNFSQNPVQTIWKFDQLDNAIQVMNNKANRAKQRENIQIQQTSRQSVFSAVIIARPEIIPMNVSSIELPKPRALNVSVRSVSILPSPELKISEKSTEYEFYEKPFSVRNNIILPMYRWKRHHLTRRTKSSGVRMSCYFKI